MNHYLLRFLGVLSSHLTFALQVFLFDEYVKHEVEGHFHRERILYTRCNLANGGSLDHYEPGQIEKSHFFIVPTIIRHLFFTLLAWLIKWCLSANVFSQKEHWTFSKSEPPTPHVCLKELGLARTMIASRLAFLGDEKIANEYNSQVSLFNHWNYCKIKQRIEEFTLTNSLCQQLPRVAQLSNYYWSLECLKHQWNPNQ